MSLRDAIETAVAGREVPAKLLEAAFDELVAGTASPVEIAALLVALRTKGETVAEIVAAARALRKRARTTTVSDPRTVDTCGTGGDRSGTFNISTTAAFVVAGAGVPVAKHGNIAATSRAGSIDVLMALGVRVDLPVETMGRILEQVGIAPFFAREAHPAMRHLAPVRKELGFRTVVNCLGPLLNPVGARRQVIGVYAAELVTPLAEALRELGTERALVVHGDDGLDEITISACTRAAHLENGHIRALEIDPETFGLARAGVDALAGGDAAENARILLSVLEGAAGPRRDVVSINAAAALWISGAAGDLHERLRMAEKSIDTGAARGRLDALAQATGEAADQ